jgi:hypothetical protein
MTFSFAYFREGDLRVIRPFVYVREKDLRQFAEEVRSQTWYKSFLAGLSNYIHVLYKQLVGASSHPQKFKKIFFRPHQFI